MICNKSSKIKTQKGMNKKNLTIGIFILFIFIIGLNSCSDDEKNLKRDTYIVGAEIVDNMIKNYQQVEEGNFISKYQNELISILTSTDSVVSLYDFSNTVFTADMKQKVTAFRALKKVYNTCNLLSDNNFNLQNTDLANFVTIACNSLDSLELSEDVGTKVEEIRNYVMASKFSQELAIYELTLVYQEVWVVDSENWIEILNSSYDKYSAGLESVPMDVFNQDKLEKFVYEPYQGKEMIVKIYKLNLKDEAYKQISESIEKIDFLTEAIDELNFINTEFTKEIPANQDIEYKLDNLKEMFFSETVKSHEMRKIN